jgi:DNA-directed RNA polymerase specialized sigma24 family protein
LAISKGQREVVLLVGLEEMGYDEAAKILRVPIRTIGSRLARAREALRLLMGLNEETKSPHGVVRRRPALEGGIAA